MWLLFAILSALFAGLTSILAKCGIKKTDSNVATWIYLFVGGATGGSWLCYYKALQDGLASVVVPIDKLSILVTIAFSFVVFKEKLKRKAAVGLVGIVIGTLLMIV